MPYVRTQSTRELLGNALTLYRQHFLLCFGVYAAVALPVLIIQHFVQRGGSAPLIVLMLLISLFASTLAYGAMTALIADICVGVVPSKIGRASCRERV